MKKALEGVKVLELGHVISGPYCSMLLGDMGAEVIKIERPKVGEFYRSEALKNEAGISLVFPSYNRNKKSITLNLKSERAKEIIFSLIRQSDIFVENYRPGLLKKMGLGYEDLKKVNPKLIMVSISGFGQTGPYANNIAYDMTISAISGFMSLNGEPGHPTKSGPAVSDFLSGIYGALAALAALRHCQITGEGQFIDISMMECMISIMDGFFAQSQYTGVEPTSTGNRRNNYAPVNAFLTQDGYVYVAASMNKHWHNLLRLMDREDLIADERYATPSLRKSHEAELEALVSAWTIQFSTIDLVRALEDNEIPCAPVQTINQVRTDPQVAARGSLIELDYPGIGPYPMPRFVPLFSTMEIPKKNPPTLGEDNKEVYQELLVYNQEAYQKLLEDEVI